MIYKKRIQSPINLASVFAPQLEGGDDAVKFMKMLGTYEGAMKVASTLLEILDAEFRTLYDHNPIHHMESRIKSTESILEKLERKGLEPSIQNIVDHITDVVGLRIICPYVDDIYHLTDLLGKQESLTIIRKKDYINSPKVNGYRSMHLVVSVPVALSDHVEQIPVEIQLRTIAMDMWASLEHELHYKSAQQPVEYLSERLRRCAVSLADIDLRMQEIYEHLRDATDVDMEE